MFAIAFDFVVKETAKHNPKCIPCRKIKGKLDERLLVMVWTPYGEARRIISMRKANEREQPRYVYRLD